MKSFLLGLVIAIATANLSQATIHNISIVDFDFTPPDMTIVQGDTVRWTNMGSVAHTATSDPGSIDPWNSGTLNPGQSFQRQFNVVGSFPYHCTPHPFMQDTLKVDQKTGVSSKDGSPRPKDFHLQQNFPNPFNASTLISYQLPQTGEVALTIYNILGQTVRSFQLGRQSAGSYSIIWDGSDQEGSQVSSGIYFYRLRAGDNFNQVRKMTLIK